MERMDTINQRMLERNKGTVPPIYFSPRPVPTKYVALPMVDQHSTTSIKNKIYDIQKDFLPSTNAPGYSHYVDVETTLMRDSNYFPSSTSSLYTIHIPVKESQQTHPLLFTHPTMPSTPRPLPKQWIHESTQIKSA